MITPTAPAKSRLAFDNDNRAALLKSIIGRLDQLVNDAHALGWVQGTEVTGELISISYQIKIEESRRVVEAETQTRGVQS